ncbi:hypothetical protein TNIN_69731 [Trichonephila inaurata madagascariensis]|uniref:Uncharacterized protein n=1 Tax=Trichonephila inaurata madagascariensis TaxID=2747483 RepID=A0A8X6Y4J1_9ARAC|nr:hypothetical protein TNIN_69731 [Trichonephila inaurata madagascariensis]
MIHLSQLTVVPGNWAFPERYCVEFFLRPMVEQNPNLWFQQDRATMYTARQTMNQLHETFGKRLISKNSNFPWLPCSPQVTMLDFFL